MNSLWGTVKWIKAKNISPFLCAGEKISTKIQY